jgi:hypothetical protein
MPNRALVVGAAALLTFAACGSSSNEPLPDGAPHGGADALDGSVADAPDGADATLDGAGADGADRREAAAPTFAATVVTTLALPGAPVAATYNAGTKKAYFACQAADKSSAGIAVIDDVANQVTKTLTPAAVVTSLAANATTKTVYGAEGGQIDVIDSAADVISTTVKISDGSTIAGLAVDEAHDKIYVVTTLSGMTELFVLDGATNVLSTSRNPLLTPVGAPSVAVDGPTQQVFVLGVDSNSEGEIVTLDGPSGAAIDLATTKSHVDPLVSGVAALGNGTASVLLVRPGVVKGLNQGDVTLPGSVAPAGVAAGDFAGTATTLVIGVNDAGALSGFGVDTATGALSPFGFPLNKNVPTGAVAARVVIAGPIVRGREAYVALAPDPKSDAPFSPTEAIKIAVTSTPP